MFEIYRDVAGFEGLYRVSTRGSVKSLARTAQRKDGRKQLVRERILKAPPDTPGYAQVDLHTTDGKTVKKKIHCLVAETFLLRPEGQLEINHKDEIKTNNHVNNLEWVTHKENLNHGTAQRANIARMKPVLQFTKDGKFVAQHVSINAAARAVGTEANYGIYSCCIGKQKTAYGFIFKFKEETSNEIQSKCKQQQNKSADHNKTNIRRPLFGGHVLCRN